MAVAGVNVRLEDQNYVTIATVATDAQGMYTFDDLTVFDTELDVLFAQEWNEQYDVSEVVSWAWLGSLTISKGKTVEMPDFEIGLQGFEQINPPTDASYSAGDISAQTPLTFEWMPYPAASAYWVDLAQGDDSTIVWQSSLVDATSVIFDGVLNDGSHIMADNYWWGIGARKDVGNYELTVYGYLHGLVITQ